MKTTSLLVSMLFGFAVAAPMNKRALHTKTSTVIQTEVVYTTVYDGEVPEPTSTSTSSAAAFFEESTNSPVVAPTTTAAAPSTTKTSAVVVPTTTSSVVQPSSEAPKSSEEPKPTTTAPVVVPTTTQAPATTAAPTTTAAPAPVQETTSAVAEAAPTSSAAPAPTSGSGSGSGSGGEVHTGGSMTLNYFSGGLGSCGKPIADTDMTVALASDLYGASTYDVATGNPTNEWCGKQVAITYNGKTTTAKIMDKCAGCTNGGFDMTPALWEAVTGTSVGDRITGMTWTTV